ncbi:MAG: hypothetical protein WCT36_01640 [Candidatus Gracilibacteria bacterium]|jgi:hypothetical protein
MNQETIVPDFIKKRNKDILDSIVSLDNKDEQKQQLAMMTISKGILNQYYQNQQIVSKNTIQDDSSNSQTQSSNSNNYDSRIYGWCGGTFYSRQGWADLMNAAYSRQR